MAIAFDAGSNSGVKATVTSYNFTHTAGNILFPVIGCVVLSRGGASLNTDPQVTSVTDGTLNLIKAIELNDLDLAAATLVCSIWYRVGGLSAGSHTLTVNFQGTTNFSVAYGFTLSGVDQIKPLGATASSTALGQGSPDTTNITSTTDQSWLIDGIYNKIGTSLTRGANQTLISTETFPNGGTDTTDASYKGPLSTVGANSMSWTFTGVDDYNQVVAEFRPHLPTGFRLNKLRPHIFSPGIPR